MKRAFVLLVALAGIALFLPGCSKSEDNPQTSTEPPTSTTTAVSTAKSPGSNQSVAATSAQPPAPPAPPNVPKPPPTFPTTRTNAFPRLSELTNRLIAANASQTDPVLSSVTVAVARITTLFAQSVPDNTNAHARLEVALQRLSEGKEAEALGAMNSLKDAELTPEQGRMAAHVKNAVAALAVQKNFHDFPGAGNEILQIVNALRQGDPATAVHALQKVTASSPLNQRQKEVLDALLVDYAPALEDRAAESVK